MTAQYPLLQVDNLGFGELTATAADTCAALGLSASTALLSRVFRMTNYAPEAQCTPSRSALLTGRQAIRLGTSSVPLGVSSDGGLVALEQTLGDPLSAAGYSCAVYGKLARRRGRGRRPTDKGFDEWYGPPRSYDEALWPTDPWYDHDPDRDPASKMLTITRGEAAVFGGYTLFVKDGHLHWEHNYYNEIHYRVTSTEQIPPGHHVLSAEVTVDDENGFGGGGNVTLRIGKKTVGEGRFDQQVAGYFTLNETFDVGCDTCSPVSDLYESPFTFTGQIVTVIVDISEATFDQLARQHETHARWAISTQ